MCRFIYSLFCALTKFVVLIADGKQNRIKQNTHSQNCKIHCVAGGSQGPPLGGLAWEEEVPSLLQLLTKVSNGGRRCCCDRRAGK